MGHRPNDSDLDGLVDRQAPTPIIPNNNLTKEMVMVVNNITLTWNKFQAHEVPYVRGILYATVN